MTYEKAMAEVVEFENTDVITTSGEGCPGWHGGVEICGRSGIVIPYSEDE